MTFIHFVIQVAYIQIFLFLNYISVKYFIWFIIILLQVTLDLMKPFWLLLHDKIIKITLFL